MADAVLIKGPATIALGTLVTTDQLRIAAEIVQQFGYTIRLSIDQGVMTVLADAPTSPASPASSVSPAPPPA